MAFNPQYSQADAQSHLDRWSSSGKSMAEYCRDNNIRPSTFYGWRKRLKKHSQKRPSKKPQSFIEVLPEKQRDVTARIIRTEIELPIDAIDIFSEKLHSFLSLSRENQ